MKKITVTLAPGASDETRRKIENGFSELYGACECDFVTDPKLIGGFTAACDGKIYDHSIRTQLDRFIRHMESED